MFSLQGGASLAAALAITGAGAIGTGVNIGSALDCKKQARVFRSDAENKANKAWELRKNIASLNSEKPVLQGDIRALSKSVGKIYSEIA